MVFEIDAKFVTVYLNVLKQHVKNGGSIFVMDEFISEVEKDVVFDTVIYNSILSIKASTGAIGEVEDLFQKAKAEGFTDNFTSSIVCEAHANTGNPHF